MSTTKEIKYYKRILSAYGFKSADQRNRTRNEKTMIEEGYRYKCPSGRDLSLTLFYEEDNVESFVASLSRVHHWLEEYISEQNLTSECAMTIKQDLANAALAAKDASQGKPYLLPNRKG